ncbi:MAG: ATP-binding protein [Planctomycetota bacterium]|jgi:two-component system sensor histidine kinase/response regulator|nr:ATP-binding protein [Planctomycetota bacterium]
MGDTEALRRRITELEDANSSYREALDLALAMSDLRSNMGSQPTVKALCTATIERLNRVLPMSAAGFLLVDEGGFLFDLVHHEPDHCSDQLQALYAKLVDDGSFAWALEQHRPVVLPDACHTHPVMLYPLVSATGAAGMFLGILQHRSGDVSTVALDVCAIVLSACSGLVEVVRLSDRLHHHNADLERTVLERTSDLVQARDAAEGALAVKSQFLANMSHEIRTPLNGILGFLEMLAATSLQNDQKHHVSTMRRSAHSLLEIINDILDFSKIEAGKLDLEEVEFDPGDVIEDVAALFAPRAHAKGIELECDVDSTLPGTVRGDPGRIRQILSNLISNAVKFTDSGSVGLHAASGENGGLDITVSDTGIGIDAEAAKQLFQPFTQADASTTRKFGGTGLGLAISHQLTERMGGQITLDSQPGRGSAFRICLPLPVVTDDQALPEVGSTVAILLYDQHPGSRATMSRLFDDQGCTVELATGLESFASAARFDLVIADPRQADWKPAKMIATLTHLVDDTPLLLVMPASEHAALDDAMRAQHPVAFKPLRRRNLLDAVRTTIAGEQADTAAAPATSRYTANATPSVSKRILLVEDNAVNREVALWMLNQLGHETLIASNGAEALNALIENDIDLVLMDCQMPVMDGYEATKRIRAGEAGRSDIPILALTAHAFAEERALVTEAGMDDHLTKPLDFDTLRQALERHLDADPSDSDSAEAADVQSAPPLDPALLDTERIASLTTIDGSGELLKQMAQMMLSDGAARIAAIHSGKKEDVAQSAHALRGAAANLGLSALAEACQALETAAKTGAATTPEPVAEAWAAVTPWLESLAQGNTP